ncbi:MAG: hypothetical protein IBX56_13685 [Methylomicrobium sp.]|nr:hypothetical protein [Methylomicrobium sp.]
MNIKKIKILWYDKTIFGAFFNYYISITYNAGTTFVKAGLKIRWKHKIAASEGTLASFSLVSRS